MDNLNDIETIVENSFYYLFYILYATLFSIAVIALLLVVKRKTKKRENPYGGLDFHNPDRELLYEFTVIAKKEGQTPKLERLLKELEPYKYKKKTGPIDKKIIEKIQNYIKEEGL